MTYQVKIITHDDREMFLLTVPAGKHSADVFGDEMDRACQKAYAQGRQDEAELIEQKILEALKQQRQTRLN